MPRRTLFLVVLIVPCLTVPVSGEPKGWSLREVPLLDEVAEQPATEKETQQIRTLIKNLAQLDDPDIGYGPYTTGHTFSPVPEVDDWFRELAATDKLKWSESLKQLVALGPKALPFLLESLTDKTPTKLTLRPFHCSTPRPAADDGLYRLVSHAVEQIRDGGGPIGMAAGREIACNPMNPREALALKRANIPQNASYYSDSGMQEFKDLRSDHIKNHRYTVTVGDVCFVALGQIINRPYQAARYPDQGFLVVTSPAHDAKSAEAVRAPWTDKQYRQQLLASLLTDFHTRGGDERGRSDELQIGAVIRLLYYFPSESGPIIARRLRKLDVTAKTLSDVMKNHEANGLYADNLLRAVTFSKHKKVRRALDEIFRDTDDMPTALTLLPADSPERNPAVLAKLKLFLKGLPAAEGGMDSSLLKVIGERFPVQSVDIFREYMKNGSVHRRMTVCYILRRNWGSRLAVEFLTPLLSDDDTSDHAVYRVRPNDDERLPVRICDEAALTIVGHRKDLTFTLEGTHENLDQQIERIRTQLQKENRP